MVNSYKSPQPSGLFLVFFFIGLSTVGTYFQQRWQTLYFHMEMDGF